MTVRELIEALAGFPQDDEVFVPEPDDPYDHRRVSKITGHWEDGSGRNVQSLVPHSESQRRKSDKACVVLR